MILRTILSDADGVIFVTEHLQYKGWLPTLKSFGVDLTKEDYRDNHAGISGIVTAANLVEIYNLSIMPEELLAQKHALLKQWFNEKKPELFPYTKEALQFFKKHFGFGIVTGAKYDEIMLKIERAGLYNILKDVPIISESHPKVMNGKPAPDLYLAGLEELSADPWQTMVIEDTVAGMQSAYEAGIGEIIGIPHEFVNPDKYPEYVTQKQSLTETVNYINHNYLS
ncbi:MAG: HAD family phosphatase [Nanoarchaeota archaeon]|nr:HAD family phosphatase [Nanoarchaeota archaeon]